MNLPDKVYILTSGSYSDYTINAATLYPEVAKHYEEMHGNSIEEFKLLDRSYLQVDRVEYLSSHVSIGNRDDRKAYDPHSIRYDYGLHYNTCISDDDSLNRIFVSVSRFDYDARIEFTVKRRSNEDHNGTITRTKRIMEDTISHMKSLIEIEGWSWEMVASHYNKSDKNIIEE